MQFSQCRLKLDVVSAFQPCPRLQHVYCVNHCYLLLSRTLPVSLSLKRTFRWWASFSAQFWTSGIHLFLSTATIGTLGRRADSVVGCEQVSFVLVLRYQRARSHVLLLLSTTTILHSKEVEHICRNVWRFHADKRNHVW